MENNLKKPVYSNPGRISKSLRRFKNLLDMKQQAIEIIKGLVGHEYLYFDSSLLVKMTPHTWPLQIWGACVSPAGDIYLMDGHQEWHKLEETDRNYHEVLCALYQRVSRIEKQFKTA